MGFNRVRFGDLCGFVRGPFGGSLKKSYFVSEGIAVYEQRHAIHGNFNEIRYYITPEKFEEMGRFELLSGDLIMSCSGTMGKVSLVPKYIEQGIINQALLKISPKEKINISFLQYWMDSPDFQGQLASTTTGVAIKNVASVKVLKEIEVPLPLLPEQRRIVHLLDTAFGEIERARVLLARNLVNAGELFESRLGEVFGEASKNGGNKTIKELCRLQNGYAFKSKEFTDSGVKLLRNCNIFHDEIEWSRIAHYPENSLEEYDRFSLDEDDIVLSLDRPIISSGLKIARVSSVDLPCLLLQRVLRIKAQKVSVDYLYQWMNSLLFQKEIDPGKSLGVPHISLKEVGNIMVPLADEDDQPLIIEQLTKIRKDVETLQANYTHQLNHLTELKQSLLAKAFAGEL